MKIHNAANTPENQIIVAKIVRDGLAHDVNLDATTSEWTAFRTFSEFVLETSSGYSPSLTLHSGRKTSKRNVAMARLADAFDAACIFTGQTARRAFRG